MRINWVHLDFKGIMPAADRLVRWVHWLADQGINGLVLEYEDRLPWATWPGTFRAGLTVEQWQEVWAAARQRRMAVVPLLQTHGHLEWLLKHPQWASWRENGCFNELCPQQQVIPTIGQWLDEVVAIHGPLSWLHIGGDETWNLASCPQCRRQASASPDGRLEVYLTHLARVAREVIRRGMRPIIWADMFWREDRMDLVRRLPDEVVLCDWQYTGTGPWASVAELGSHGHKVLGASAIRCSFDLSQCLAPQQERVDNVLAWHGQPGVTGVIHTLWGRGRSLLPMYGPWEGWLPGLLAAGRPDALDGHVLRPWIQQVDAAMTGPVRNIGPVVESLQTQRFADPFAESCRQWWVLALEWRLILESYTASARQYASLRAVHDHVGIEPDYLNHNRQSRARLSEKARVWERQVRAYFAAHRLSDVDEFVASRINILQATEPADWAGDLVSVGVPRTAR